ncbi:MAG: apolipoprotein N-acyltransferase [Flavobacteriales bacterium]
MNKTKRYGSVVLSGLLLSLAWPAIGDLTPLIFVAFIPFLWVEDFNFRKRLKPRKIYTLAVTLFLVFNLSTTWWIYFASGGGMAMAVIFNSLLMAVPMWLYHLTRRFVGQKEGDVAFVLFWLGFEWCHFHWELSWPWLTMGNVFANQPNWVQWYETTGVLGGSLWVFLINLFLFKLFRNVYLNREKIHEQYSLLILVLVLFVLPLGLSFSVFGKREIKGGTYKEVVVVQPNVDPYKEKFEGGLSPEEQIERITTLAKSELTEKTALVVTPETAIPFSLDEEAFGKFQVVEDISLLTREFKTLRLITGASTHRYFFTDQKPSYAAESLSDEKGFVEYYNTAVQIQSGLDKYDFYRKAKLVLGVEKIPFSNTLTFLSDLALEMGGTSGNLGFDPEPVVFESDLYNRDLKVAPVICYESIYGEYVTDYIKKGANLIAIVTNDGWWDDTPGYKQHLAYARLRAIENRRSIVRSANTGISAIINEWGEVEQKTSWWEPAVLKAQVRINNERTYYSRHGDFIGRTAFFVAVLLILYTIVRYIKH